eukprot:NODE_4222_length_685_cov_10.762579_g3589_i0.p1 GENE.NODE_4222_length_685_cov_10.762579_g3589_i0~~NODE_4222_length_685_cov_10.762579_g3589_i0.p1  ORF type:complete len:186 (+),score=52.21 NODE_4222_length_685_cov_10.762579_g3589_i0:45-560(+)
MVEDLRERLEARTQELQQASEIQSRNDHLMLQLEFLQRDNVQLDDQCARVRTDLGAQLAQIQKQYGEEKRQLLARGSQLQSELQKERARTEKRKVKFATQILKSEQRVRDAVDQLEVRESELRALRVQLQTGLRRAELTSHTPDTDAFLADLERHTYDRFEDHDLRSEPIF